jgi:hypothetical protein
LRKNKGLFLTSGCAQEGCWRGPAPRTQQVICVALADELNDQVQKMKRDDSRNQKRLA